MTDAPTDEEMDQAWAEQQAIRAATADLRAHLHVDDCPEENVQLNRMQLAAEGWIEAYVGKPLAEFDPLPAAIRMAVLMLAGHFYENREASLVGVTAGEVPFGVRDLVAPYRAWEF